MEAGEKQREKRGVRKIMCLRQREILNQERKRKKQTAGENKKRQIDK